MHSPTHLQPTLPSLLAIILRQYCHRHISMELSRSCAERLGGPNRSCHLKNVLRQYSHRSECMEASRGDYSRSGRGSTYLCDDTAPGKPLSYISFNSRTAAANHRCPASLYHLISTHFLIPPFPKHPAGRRGIFQCPSKGRAVC